MTAIKRQALVLQALAHTQEQVKVRFAGPPDVRAHAGELRDLARRLGVDDRVEWLGRIDEEEKRSQFDIFC